MLHESQEMLSHSFHFSVLLNNFVLFQSFAFDAAKVGPSEEKPNDASLKNMFYNIFLDLHQ